MKNTFEIQIVKESVPANALMLIKKKTNLSLAVIKDSAANNHPFFGCKLSDDKSLELIIDLHEELREMGVETTLLDEGAPSSIEIFRNILESHKKTARQIGLDLYIDF